MAFTKRTTKGSKLTIDEADANTQECIDLKAAFIALLATRTLQTIAFTFLPAKKVGNPDFTPDATASSGLPISFESSNSAVATIVNNKVHFVSDGVTNITAKQEGNALYAPAIPVTRSLTVSAVDLAPATLTFPNFSGSKTTEDAAFDLVATSTNTVTPITFESSNPLVASVALVGSVWKVTPLESGFADITAIQDSGNGYGAANPITRRLTIENITGTAVIFSGSGFTDLTGMVGDGTVSVANGKIKIAEGNVNDGLLIANKTTALDIWDFEIFFRLITTLSNPDDQNNYGLSVGIKSLNTAASDLNLGCYIWAGNQGGGNSANGYTLLISTSYAGTYFTSVSPDHIKMYTNDYMRMKVSKNKGIHTIEVENITRSLTASFHTEDTFTFSSNPQQNIGANTGQFRIGPAGHGDYEISQIRITTPITNVDKVAVGDSITKGAHAGSASGRWGELIGASIQAGSGDRVREVLLRVPEIINIIKPNKVYLMIGTNDGATGITPYMNDLTSIYDQLTTAGITVYLMTPPARNDSDMSVFRNAIIAAYPTAVDVFEVTKQSGNSLIKPEFNSGDNVHLTTAGHLAIAQAIVDAGYATLI